MPAPIINGGGDRLWKWSNFRLSWARDLDLELGSGHTAYTVMHHSSTSTYMPNFIKIEETFCGRTDIWDPIVLLGRLGGVDLKNRSLRHVAYMNNKDAIWVDQSAVCTWNWNVNTMNAIRCRFTATNKQVKKSHTTVEHSKERIPSSRHTEISTVSLPACNEAQQSQQWPRSRGGWVTGSADPPTSEMGGQGNISNTPVMFGWGDANVSVKRWEAHLFFLLKTNQNARFWPRFSVGATRGERGHSSLPSPCFLTPSIFDVLPLLSRSVAALTTDWYPEYILDHFQSSVNSSLDYDRQTNTPGHNIIPPTDDGGKRHWRSRVRRTSSVSTRTVDALRGRRRRRQWIAWLVCSCCPLATDRLVSPSVTRRRRQLQGRRASSGLLSASRASTVAQSPGCRDTTATWTIGAHSKSDNPTPSCTTPAKSHKQGLK